VNRPGLRLLGSSAPRLIGSSAHRLIGSSAHRLIGREYLRQAGGQVVLRMQSSYRRAGDMPIGQLAKLIAPCIMFSEAWRRCTGGRSPGVRSN
jgi:hypothetical protein